MTIAKTAIGTENKDIAPVCLLCRAQKKAEGKSNINKQQIYLAERQQETCNIKNT